MEYAIRKADTPELYDGLRNLWCRVFGDTPGFVDRIYEIFGGDIAGYVITDAEDKVISSVTCYRCGTYELPVYVSYAVCTDPEFRGMGFGGRLTAYVRDKVLAEGGISIVSPASEELADFYKALGYSSCFTASEQAVSADMADGFGEGWEEDEDDFDGYEPFEPGLSVTSLDPETYNAYRETFLDGEAHISLSHEMLEMAQSETAGGNGLFLINGGDAVCALADDGKTTGKAAAYEFLVNPLLAEISSEIECEIAARLARHLGAEMLTYRSAGPGRLQSMIAIPGGVSYTEGSYFGFPLD